MEHHPQHRKGDYTKRKNHYKCGWGGSHSSLKLTSNWVGRRTKWYSSHKMKNSSYQERKIIKIKRETRTHRKVYHDGWLSSHRIRRNQSSCCKRRPTLNDPSNTGNYLAGPDPVFFWPHRSPSETIVDIISTSNIIYKRWSCSRFHRNLFFTL